MRLKTKCDGWLLLCLWATTLMAVGAPHAIELKDGTVDPDGRTVWYDAQYLGVEGKGCIRIRKGRVPFSPEDSEN